MDDRVAPEGQQPPAEGRYVDARMRALRGRRSERLQLSRVPSSHAVHPLSYAPTLSIRTGATAGVARRGGRLGGHMLLVLRAAVVDEHAEASAEVVAPLLLEVEQHGELSQVVAARVVVVLCVLGAVAEAHGELIGVHARLG